MVVACLSVAAGLLSAACHSHTSLAADLLSAACIRRVRPSHPFAPMPPHSTVPTAQQARLISEQLRQQGAAPAAPLQLGDGGKPERTEIEAGPVVVRVLGAQPTMQPSQSAQDFLQQRLQVGVKRSAQMLRPARTLQPAWIEQRSQFHAQKVQRRTPAAAGGQAALQQQTQQQQERQQQRQPRGGGTKPKAKRRR